MKEKIFPGKGDKAMAQSQVRTLGTVLYENFELLDVYGPLEMFGSIGPELRLVTIAQKAGAVTSTQGPQTVAQYSFENCPPIDLILLPGGIGTIPELENEALLTFLRQRSATAEITMSVCSGSAILAKAGLLDGHRATSNKQFFALAASQSDKVQWVEQARWVEDGKFATSSGVSAGIDMALAIIARLYGKDRAEQIAAGTEYEWHQDSTWDPFVKYLNQGDASQLPPPASANRY
jgi:transcriptional regulator GlxA family with amidase domain